MTVLIRMQGTLARIVLDDPAPMRSPFLAALVEARGALLHWDAASDPAFPDADIDDVGAAAAWLVDVYGASVAEAVALGAPAAVTAVPGDTRVLDAVLHLGTLTWAQAWWPAGARVAALDRALLASEIAVTSHAVDHLLDDEDAVERALEDAMDSASALALLPASLAEEGRRLAETAERLADGLGVALAPAATARAEWALAAGGNAAASDGIVVATGAAPVRWADVPSQTVDAEAEAEWTLHLRDGSSSVRIVVRAVDAPHEGRGLLATFGRGELGIDVPLERGSELFRGEAEVPASFALVPDAERMLWVRDPLLSAEPGPRDDDDDRERALAFASRRTTLPRASIAERAAGTAW